MQQAVKLIDRIAEPRRVSIAMAGVYFCGVLAGALSLISPPEHVITYIGQGAMTILAICLIIGGLIGIPTALTGYQKVEESALFFLFLGGSIYFVVIFADYVVGPGNRPIQASFVAMGLLFFYGRWERIRHLAFNPVLSKKGREIDEAIVTGDILKK